MFLIYTQVENHILNPVVMSKTVRVNPLLVLLSILIGASIGDWIGGTFGAFVAALLAIPAAGALQVVTRELWQDHRRSRSQNRRKRRSWPSKKNSPSTRSRPDRRARWNWAAAPGHDPASSW